MKGIYDKTEKGYRMRTVFIRRAAMVTLLFFICVGASLVQADAASKTFNDSDGGTISDPDTEYTIKGSGSRITSTKYFDVPEGKSSQSDPITIILDGVNITQEDKSPDHSFIHIEGDNYVIIKLRNRNYVRAWSHQETLSSNDGMSAIHVSKDSTVKITSEQGDGSTEGSLTAYGGGGKYGGAGIGARYNKKMGTLIIAGGTIEAHGGTGAAGIGGGRNDTDGYEHDVQITGGKVKAYGGDEGAGIGSGRDGKAYSIGISGGDVYAEGGKYAAGIGAGNAVNVGSGGNIVDLSITGGKIEAHGGAGGAGIGCSDEGEIENRISIDSTSSAIDIEAYGGDNAAGIGGGNKSNLDFEDRIEIKGSGTVSARGGIDGAGIGGGNDGGGPRIDIEGNTNGQYGSRGAAPEGSRTLEITAVAGRSDENDDYSFGNEAAAIGSGKATGGDISISNAVVSTRADGEGADIGGGGYHMTPGGAVQNIYIRNCEIASTSTHKVAPGIGSGYGGTVHNITIIDSKYVGGGIGGAPMDYNYTNLNDVKSIIIDNSDISAVWDQANPGRFEGGTTPSTEPQEHGAAGIGSGQYGSMDTITITGSRITASGYGSGSGIGGGGLGGNGFMFFDFTKWESGDTGTITISESDVDARSGKANFDPHSPIVYWDGHVWIKIDNPTMFGGGAGIGGGSGADTDKIWIHDCGEIRAVGDGCGIGTGEGTGKISKGAVKYIWLENIDRVYAEAGHNCAGIGTGGSDGGLNEWNIFASALTQIYIDNCRDLEARGGEGGAGIGLGSRSTYHSNMDPTEKSSWPMEIVNSNISASGGAMGAGIGGGFEDVFTGMGGESPKMLIRGKTTVYACGGEALEYEDGSGLHGGGAGIGGGADAAGSVIQIELDEDYSCAAKGTLLEPSASKYFVRAFGNGGGAGIGSGGITFHERFLNHEDADTFEVKIKSGAVFAAGSDSTRLPEGAYRDFYMGAGAGIGGGSLGSKISNLIVEGGYVYAEAGANTNNRDKADAIGAGGLASRIEGGLVDSNRENGYLQISDGTVISDNIGTFINERKISGGSVKAVVDRATGVVDTKGERVYRTTAKLPENITNEKVDAFSTSRGYGRSHIYADENGKVYLWLYEKGSSTDHKQWADIEVNTEAAGSNDWHYTGYTNTSNTGILKIEGDKVDFKDPGTVRWGGDFTLQLSDEDLSGSKWTFAASGSAKIDSVTKDTSPGAGILMHADSMGDYTVTASSGDTEDECYWGSTAEYAGTVSKAIPEISFTEDPSKTYDSTHVTDPSVTSSGGGKVTYEYFTDEACTEKTGAESGAGTAGGAPKNAGTYWVKASVAATDVYESGSDTLGFEISPAAVSVSVELRQSGSSGTASATVAGLYEADGKVQFTIKKDGETYGEPEKVDVSYSGGIGAAELTKAEMPEGEYSVEAVFIPSEKNNYLQSRPATADGVKDRTERSIQGERSYTTTYGNNDVKLELSASEGDAASCSWHYEVIWDSYHSNHDTFDQSVTVDQETGNVTVCHAGRSVIRVTLIDPGNTYYDAVAFAVVEVSRKDLEVSSFAYKKGGDPKTDKVDEATYGKLSSTLEYDLGYEGFINGDSETTSFIGSLNPVPVAETSGVKGSPYDIEIARNGAFVSRDYKVTYIKGQLKVSKASLAIQINDAIGIFGGTEPEYTWKVSDDQSGSDGLAAWDSEQTVFSSDAVIGLKSGNYKDLDAETYQNVLIAKDKGQSDNYDPSFSRGSLTVEPADLSDDKRFSSSAEDTVYNGAVQKQDVAVTDIARDAKLTENTDYTLTYPAGGMKDAGSVKVTVSGKGNYTGQTEAVYGIERRPLDATTKSAEKVYDGKPLTAGGTLTGLAAGETATLDVTGSRTEVGRSRNTCEVKWDGSAKESNYVLKKDLGTLTVTAPETVYVCVDGAGSRWQYGSRSALPFTISRNWHDDETYDLFRAVAADGKRVPEGSCSVKRPASGIGAVISLEPSYLEELGIGSHSLSVAFSDGAASDIPFSVVKGTADLVFTEDPTKTYDTEPVSDPAVKTESTGAVTYEYFTDEKCTKKTGSEDGAGYKGGAPKNAGRYWVKAGVEATDVYRALSKKLQFDIYAAPTSVSVDLSQSGSTGTAKAVILGIYGKDAEAAGGRKYFRDGRMVFTVRKDDGTQVTETVDTIELVDSVRDIYAAELSNTLGSALKYNVTARFVPAKESNYSGSSGSASGRKNLESRSINIEGDPSVGRTYGDEGFDLNEALNITTDHATDNDEWTYEVIWDSQRAQGNKAAVSIDRMSGDVTIVHAGRSFIRITLSDGHSVYNDAFAYAEVVVDRTELKVITEGALKIYDGKPLTAPGEMNGLVMGETAELKVTGSQTAIGSSINTFEIIWKTANESNYRVVSETGTLAVVSPETKYYCEKGNGGVWKRGSSKGLSFTFKRSWNDEETFDRFRGISVDGKKVPAGAYTAEAGSVIVTVSPEYLDKLGSGEHVLSTAFNDGTAPDIGFSVTGDGSGGKGAGTGDNNSIVLWIAILITAAAGLCVLTLKRRKEEEQI